MNVNLIRAVDKWVGIPACFCISSVYGALARCKRRCPRPDRIQTPGNILFIELSEMGSTVIAYPAMRYVQARYPGAKLHFLTFQQNRFSVDILDVVPPDRIITIDVGSPDRFLFSTLGAVNAIRNARIDTVFDLELFSRFSALLTGVSGAQRRVGYGKYQEEGLYRGTLMTHRVFYNCHQHMWKNFMALVRAIEREGEYPMERLAAFSSAVRDAQYVVVMNPSAGSLLPIRAWPVENYRALAERIIERWDAVIVLIGLEDARDAAAILCEQVGKLRCIDFTGQTSFKDLMDLMNLGHALVTADSGPAHFAALTKIHNIVLFGPETPTLYKPLGNHATALFAGLSCSPCLSAYNHRDTRCADPQCMKAITVDAVFDALSSALSGIPD
jgi:ADP-heptose:LPS heptosyltransferase